MHSVLITDEVGTSGGVHAPFDACVGLLRDTQKLDAIVEFIGGANIG